MSLASFLAHVVDQLDAVGVDFMIGGSVASSIYGEPRTTRDVDIVVAVDDTSLRDLFARFDRTRVYIDEPADDQPVRAGQMFNLLDMDGGWKVDLVVRKGRPFSIAEFARRQRQEVLGVASWVASVEDVILTKLEWAARSGSSRQIDDVRGIVAVQGDQLDLDYLRTWATSLQVDALLESCLAGDD